VVITLFAAHIKQTSTFIDVLDLLRQRELIEITFIHTASQKAHNGSGRVTVIVLYRKHITVWITNVAPTRVIPDGTVKSVALSSPLRNSHYPKPPERKYFNKLFSLGISIGKSDRSGRCCPLRRNRSRCCDGVARGKPRDEMAIVQLHFPQRNN
jgi:hypothetical protein